MWQKILILVSMLVVSSVAGTLRDSRDGKTYKTVKIGKQVWMAENLNYKTSGSVCYDNKDSNCKKYGRLYTWDEALNACPTGWHLPSVDEIGTLLATVGASDKEQSENLRAGSWKNGKDKYGFSALPAGNYYSFNKEFNGLGSYALFWSSTESSSFSLNAYNLGFGDYGAYVDFLSKDGASSVRCLQDSNEGGEASSQRSEAQPPSGTLKDSRDGKTYKTVQIGNQTWMAENLNYKTGESKCYDNKESNCKKYGRLYTWDEALNACPTGWHLPSKEEFGTLLATVGASSGDGSNLRAGSWKNGKNKYGFSALPAGLYYSDYKKFYSLGIFTSFWSSTENTRRIAYALYIGDSLAVVDDDGGNYGGSVRCLQDSNEGGEASSQRSEAQPPSGTLKDSRDGQTYKTVQIGNQTWMAENLNYKAGESKCYDNKESNCKKYGRLYTWDDAKKACPTGWHLPSEDEFGTLLATVGASSGDRSENLRAGSWKNGKDKYGFSALPAGNYDSYRKEFNDLGDYTYFWVSTELYSEFAYLLGVGDSRVDVLDDGEDYGGSVRCLQDSNEGGEASSQRSEAQPPSGTLKDSRDGKTYKTVKIGNQTWMAENLNYKTGESKCYDNKESNCKKYGRLYTWDEALNACPTGWHLPSEDEFGTLLATVGASRGDRSENLRAGSWKNGKDKFGFSALPAGYYNSFSKKFYGLGDYTSFWSSTEGYSGDAYFLDIRGSGAYINAYGKNNGYSVRCLQDSNEGGEASSQRSEAQPPSGTLKDSRDGQTYKTVQIGNQTWMAENLNYKTGESKCYDNKESNCKKYGRLYTWDEALNACPTGWHLPSEDEFGTLLATVGASSGDGSNLRAGSWKNGKDKYGFSALPAGDYYSGNEEFDYLGYYTNFWTSTETNSFTAYYLGIYDSIADVNFDGKRDGNSVRCLQD